MDIDVKYPNCLHKPLGSELAVNDEERDWNKDKQFIDEDVDSIKFLEIAC